MVAVTTARIDYFLHLSTRRNLLMYLWFEQVVEIYSTQLPVYILMHLLGPESVLPSLRFSLCPQVSQSQSLDKVSLTLIQQEHCKRDLKDPVHSFELYKFPMSANLMKELYFEEIKYLWFFYGIFLSLFFFHRLKQINLMGLFFLLFLC